MNRPIKFRVWHKEFKRFLTPDEWFLNLDGDLYFNELIGFGERTMVKCNPKYYEIMQYTGLNDCNGKEICEGDIVETIYSTDGLGLGVVCYDFNTCAFRIAVLKTHFLPLVTLRFEGSEKPQFVKVAKSVLGNIFENPELLKYE